MPRNVRNFWLTFEVDGKKTTVASGPVRKDGGFSLRVQIRDSGAVTTAGYLIGKASEGGVLTVDWFCDGTSEPIALAKALR